MDSFALGKQDGSLAGADEVRRNMQLKLHERARWRYVLGASLLATGIVPQTAHASMFHGETLDAVANGISWAVLFIVPIVGLVAFWLVHILPEKIAEKKHHPQAKAIQTLCLLSLFFGGILWPLAWIWTYTKPVLYKLAYGTDTADPHGKIEEKKAIPPEEELHKLREQVAQLTLQLKSDGKGGKA